MKKILLLLIITVLLTSCGVSNTGKTKKEVSEISEFSTQKSYGAGKYRSEKDLDMMDEEIIKAKKESDANFLKYWTDAEKYSFSDSENTEEYLPSPWENYKLKKVVLDSGEKYIVESGDEVVYESDETFMITSSPFKSFIVDDTGWWLLYDKNIPETENSKLESQTVLVHNGEKIKNYEVFSLVSLNGKTFYFFKKTKNSKIKYYLDGKTYKTVFNEIIHDKCCSYAAFNLVISLDGKIKFWGVKDGYLSMNEVLTVIPKKSDDL